MSRSIHSCHFLVAIVLFQGVGLPSRVQETPRDAIRVQTALVNVPVIVTDEQGRYIPGLTSPDFKLFQDGMPQTVDLFGALQQPLKVALMLDTSKSTITVLGKIKKAASSFLKQLRPQDQAMIVTFDSEINLACYLTDDQRELEEALRGVRVGSSVGTRMRDAILDMTTRRFQRTQGRRAIVILTDGQDNGSQTTAADLMAAVSGSDIPIYSVFYHVDPRELAKKLFGVSMPKARTGGRTWEQQENEAASYLRKLSEASAGRLYHSGTEDLKTTFAKVAEELRHQYLLGFYPQKDKLDGKSHTLRVEVDRPGALVRARNSYRASP